MNKFTRLPQPHIGHLIQQLRREIGLTQEEFASYFDVVLSTVNRWEQGEMRPSPMEQKLIFLELEKMGDRGREILKYYQSHSFK